METMIRKKIITKTSEDGGEGLWAVSYADLLMVMMSFFIVFFNLEQKSEQKPSSIQKYLNIVVSLADDEILKKDTASGKVYKTLIENKMQDKNFFSLGFSPDVILPKVQFKEVPAVKDGHLYFSDIAESKEFETRSTGTGLPSDNIGILINFSDDIFELGSYELSEKAKKELTKVLISLSRHKKEINLVFIGHSDQLKVSGRRKIVKTNLALSALRASSAVDYAIEQGFDPLWVSAHGMGEYARKTRSLSLRVVVK
jgi:flagellar motor protein MotB